MALKDLIADKTALTEEAIETIVAPYVRYDADAGEIAFTPAGVDLKNDRKLLVYLTAIIGWQYVTENPPQVATKPADLERTVGIHGGTLRPLLKILKDRHLIVANDGSYVVRSANLSAVRAIVTGEAKSVPKKRGGKLKTPTPTKTRKNTAAKGKASPQLSVKITAWIKDGYFSKWQTLKKVHERLHEQGVIVDQTSVSGPLLRAVRDGILVREKQQIDGKAVWAYRVAQAVNI